MKFLVTVKRVEDPEIKIKIKSNGTGIETDAMKYVINPFDDIALEEALRLRDVHGGEVVVACVGATDATNQIRTALAMGADRAIHVVANATIDPFTEASALKAIIAEENPDLIILGKQAIDDDMGQVGGMLAEMLQCPQATFASKESSLESEDEKNKVPAIRIANNRAEVVREVDGGIETLSVSLPAVITTELRLNIPRYASLPGIMKAKKKEIKERNIQDVVPHAPLHVNIIKLETPKTRAAGSIVPDVATLVAKLKNEAKVI